ncbi:MAG: branched-chain amino acid ABC transporter permease [Chloroflexota bacterium]
MNDLWQGLRKNRTLILTLLVLALLFLMATQGMSTNDWVITALRGLSVGAVTFLVAAGFSIILGLMDVLNLAQGTLFMVGAYVGWSVFVRPDTFLDVLTPIILLVAGFMLGPLWKNLLARLSLPRQVARIWPWLVLILALLLLAITLPRVPITMWNHEDYSDSPVVWTMNYEGGLTPSLIVPARFVDTSPILCWLGLLLASGLISLSLTGFSWRRSGGGPSAARLPWKGPLLFFVLAVVGIGIYWFNDELTAWMLGLDSTLLFFFAVVVATLTGAALGALMEASLIRPLYARPTYQLMLTLGLGLLGIEMVRAIWGRSGFTMPRPSFFANSGEGCPATSLAGWLQNKCRILEITIGGETARIRTYNEIFVILMGLIVLVVVWLLIQRTRLGMVIRAGVQDSEMVEALGINVRQVFTLVFALGVGLAALGGVLSGPSTGLSDLMGEHLLLGGLIALAIGGLTSYPGAAVGSVLVGLVQQFIIKYGQIGIKLPFLAEPFKPTPPLVPSSTVLLMIIILVIMPQGLLGRKE